MSDTDRAGLLQAIAANLDDPFPRLAYADWWEERGECDVAGVIREFAEPVPRIDFEDCLSLGALFPHALRRFLSESIATRIDDDRAVFYRSRLGAATANRGLISRLAVCDLAWWLEHGPSIVRRHPIRSVSFRGFMPYVPLESRGCVVRFSPDCDPSNEELRRYWELFRPEGSPDCTNASAYIPREFLAYMTGNLVGGQYFLYVGRRAKGSIGDSVGESTRDLSDAAIAWARDQPESRFLPTT